MLKALAINDMRRCDSSGQHTQGEPVEAGRATELKSDRMAGARVLRLGDPSASGGLFSISTLTLAVTTRRFK
jgi:hypothetical protein